MATIINCNTCRKPVPDHMTTCPYCNAKILQPQIVETVQHQASGGGERTVWEGAPEWKAYTPWFILAVLTIPTIVVPFVIVACILIDKYRYQFKVTTKRIICTYGLLSKKTCEVDINDIRSTNVSQNFIDRMLGVGNIEFTTASGPLKEAIMVKILAPEILKERIRALRAV